VHGTADHDADVAAIEGLVADAEKAFNTNDPELLTAPIAHKVGPRHHGGRRATRHRTGYACPLRPPAGERQMVDRDPTEHPRAPLTWYA